VNHHLLGQSIFDLHGDEAYGETFFVFHAIMEGNYRVSLRPYIDYFRRIDSEWKVVYRRVVPDHTLTLDDLTNYWPAAPETATTPATTSSSGPRRATDVIARSGHLCVYRNV